MRLMKLSLMVMAAVILGDATQAQAFFGCSRKRDIVASWYGAEYQETIAGASCARIRTLLRWPIANPNCFNGCGGFPQARESINWEEDTALQQEEQYDYTYRQQEEPWLFQPTAPAGYYGNEQQEDFDSGHLGRDQEFIY